MSDSLMIEVTGQGIDRLEKAIDLCALDSATGLETRGNSIVIYWHRDSKTGQPFSIDPKLYAAGIIKWLEREMGSSSGWQAPDYGPKPDIDGHCEKGWKLTTDFMQIIITPIWMIYHK